MISPGKKIGREELQVLGQLLEKYRAQCVSEGLLNLAKKVASVRTCVAYDADHPRPTLFVVSGVRHLAGK